MLPVVVMGSVMGKDISGSNHLIQRMIDGAMPAFPNLFIPIIDVRDVASAHILAMTNPGAAGERFLLSNGRALPMKEIGAIIKADLGDAAKRVPTRSIPNPVLRIVALFNAELRPSLTSATPKRPPTRRLGGCSIGHHATPTRQSSRRRRAWSERACSGRDLARRAHDAGERRLKQLFNGELLARRVVAS